MIEYLIKRSDNMNDLIQAIFITLKNPYILTSLLLAILINIYYSKFRGYMGEFWVKLELKKLSQKEYKIFNNIMLEDKKGTHQIDHIIISKYGIFVIEMKNYYGIIKGDDNKDKWIQYLGKNKYYFKNPLNQNYGHVKALEDILKINNSYFIPIICFSNSAKLNVTSKKLIVQLNYLIETIKTYNTEYKDLNINCIEKIIKDNNIIDKTKRKQHIKDIKSKIKLEQANIENMICPKCKSKLVKRNGKYGTFIGCSNYPKCKFIKR